MDKKIGRSKHSIGGNEERRGEVQCGRKRQKKRRGSKPLVAAAVKREEGGKRERE